MRLVAAPVLVLALSAAAHCEDKRVKWEYAELVYRVNAPRPTPKDGAGNEVPAVPPSASLRWTTGDEEVTMKGWDELAEKFKAPVKKEASASVQKVRALNALGAEGWELVDQQPAVPSVATAGGGFGRGPGTSTTYTFKRRVP